MNPRLWRAARSLQRRVAPRGGVVYTTLEPLVRPRLSRIGTPLVSILLPVDGSDQDALLETVTSLLQQTAGRWELLLTGTSRPADLALPDDPRIVWCASSSTGRAAALNTALTSCRSGFVAAIEPGDQLHPQAVDAMLEATSRASVDILYSDEEVAASQPFRKPDWSPETILSFPYTGRLCFIRAELARRVGGWDESTVTAEDYRLVLAVARQGGTIRRIPRVLYRRTVHIRERLTARHALEARRLALSEHFAALGLDAAVEETTSAGRLRVRPRLSVHPLISIIITTRDRLPLLRQCIDSIERESTYPNIEIVLVDNDSSDPETLAYLDRSQHRVVRAPGPFNFSRINNIGARSSRGEYLLFLNNDTEVRTADWLTAMVEWAQMPGIGCVGAKLLFPDGTVQHAGVILHDGSAFHVAYGRVPGQDSWFDTDLVRNYSAVTAACLMVRRSLFEEVGGFDETFQVAYNDVDLCVRIMQRGYRNLSTPYAELVHHESASRTPGVTLGENDRLQRTIGRLLWNDPYCPASDTSGPGVRYLARFPRFRRAENLRRTIARGMEVVRAALWERQSLKGFDAHGGSTDRDPVRWLDRVEIADQVRIGLFMHPVSERTFRLMVPRGGRFAAWLALLPDAWTRNSGGVTFEVRVGLSGIIRRTHRWVIDPGAKARHRRWRRVTVRLSEFAGQHVELTLATTLPSGAAPAHAWSVWGDPLVLSRKAARTIARRQTDLVKAIGLRAAIRRYGRLLRGGAPDPAVYGAWFESQKRGALDARKVQSAITGLRHRPRISVVTPVYNTDPQWLRRCIDSVRQQAYTQWEHCIADDGSTRTETLATLRTLAAADPRIKVTYLDRNAGISAASNAALALAGGEFVALLDHDDELAPEALLEIASAINESPDSDVIYTDEDKLEFDGRHVEPYFKPDWSPEYLRSTMYMGHVCVYRRSLLHDIGGFRSAFDGAQDYDLALRATERARRVHHIPKVLYHWRKIPGSAAADQSAKPWGLGAAKEALADHVSRLPVPASVEDEPGNGFWRVRYAVVGEPLVSVIIATDGRTVRTMDGRPRDYLLECVRSIVERTTYPHYELIVVDNGRVSSEALSVLRTVPHRRVSYEAPTPFNFAAKVNFSARHASGDHLLLLNDDTEVITGEWISAMLEFSQQRAIGAVGAKLFYPDGRIQHVGVVLGIGGGACHVFAGQAGNSPGYFGSALVIRNYSAVTGACCMTRREVFEEVGGFDERFARDFNDVDYCLRVRSLGYRIVSTPFARLYHYEGATLGSRERAVSPTEIQALSERWRSVIDTDPYYNPNLTRSGLDCSLRL